MYYKCNKCGDIIRGKSNIPLEHGKMSLTFYPDKAVPSTKCSGTYEEYDISEDK